MPRSTVAAPSCSCASPGIWFQVLPPVPNIHHYQAHMDARAPSPISSGTEILCAKYPTSASSWSIWAA